MSDHPRYPLLPAEDTINGLTDAEAEGIWRRLRWPGTDGVPVCPGCSGTEHYDVSSDRSRSRWRCKMCVKDVSLLGGTVFHGSKLPLQHLLLVLSLVQYSKGDMVISRTATERGWDKKTTYVLVCKAQEMLAGDLERRSAFVGYMSTKGSRYGKAEFPRAKIAAAVETKICDRCRVTKPSSDFQYRCGTAKDWGLTASVCKQCKNSSFGEKIQKSWLEKKVSAETAVILDRPVSDLLAKPRYPDGYLWQSRAWWTPQDKHDLATLAGGGATPEQAAAALGRTAESIAWRARDLLSHSVIPLSWKRIFQPPRLTVPAQPRLFAYPYLPTLTKLADVSGARLTVEVSALVSRAYPDFMRADICQTVLLAILEDKTTLNDLQGSPDLLRAFVRSYRRDQDVPRMVASLDAPRWNDDDQDSHGSTLPAGVMNRLEW